MPTQGGSLHVRVRRDADEQVGILVCRAGYNNNYYYAILLYKSSKWLTL